MASPSSTERPHLHDRLLLINRMDGNEDEETGQEDDCMNHSNNAEAWPTADEAHEVALRAARVEQASTDSASQSSLPSEQTRVEEAQPDAPMSELDVYAGDLTSLKLPTSDGFLQRVPGYEDTWRPVISVSDTQQPATPRETAGGDGGPDDDVLDNNSSSNDSATIFNDREEDGAHPTLTQIEHVDSGSPLRGIALFDPTDRSFVYTDLSRTQQIQSSENLADAHLGRATSSNLQGSGDLMNQMPRDGDSSTEVSEAEQSRRGRTTESDEDSNVNYFEGLGTVTPLPTPPRSPAPTLHRDTASVSSTGPTARSLFGQDEVQEVPAMEGQSLFTEDRRTQLRVAIASDIARYSQEREWAFYQEHRYCVFPIAESPSRNEETIINADTMDVPGNGGESTRAMSPAPSTQRTTTSPRQNNRATLPSPLLGRRPVYELPDPAGEFLGVLLNIPYVVGQGARIRQQDEQFEEENVPTCHARFRFSLLPAETDASEPQLGGEAALRVLRLRLIGLLAEMVNYALGDGMDGGEAELFMEYWITFSYARSQDGYPEIRWFLPVSAMRFWTALRRGWGNWHPSQTLLNQVRRFLEDHTNFCHTPDVSIIQQSGELGSITASRLRSSNLPQEEKDRFEELQAEGLSAPRIAQLLENWVAFIEAEVLEARGRSEAHFSNEEVRLDRLERLIREERLLNAQRGVNDSMAGDGQIDQNVDGN